MDRLQDARKLTLAIVLASTPASAQHDHTAHARTATHVTLSVGAIAASYRSMLFDGDYQGGSVGVGLARSRFQIAGSFSAYRITRNGRVYRGLGDAMVHGHAMLLRHDNFFGGAQLMMMLPIGDDTHGLGMGHFMVAPAIWAAWLNRQVSVNVAVGYARGIGDASIHAEHGGGAWPLVEPMSFSELTFDTTAMLSLARGLRAGPRVSVAIPTDGDARMIGAVRIAWRAGRVETTAEAQAGLVGDPVRMRGVVSTSVDFE